MITFQNNLTQHIFTLPKDKALEIISQEPKIYNIISGIEKDLLINPSEEIPKTDLKNDIYNLVVVADVDCEVKKKTTKKTTAKKRKTTKRKTTKVKKKEK